MEEVKRERRLRMLFWLSLAASFACVAAMRICNPAAVAMDADLPWFYGFVGFAFLSAVVAQ